MEIYIFSNRVQCMKCFEIIESYSQNDYVTCSCGTLSVDGGRSYLRRTGDPDFCEELCVTYTDLDKPRIEDLETHKNSLDTFPKAVAYTLLEYKGQYLSPTTLAALVEHNFSDPLSTTEKSDLDQLLKQLVAIGVLEGSETYRLTSDRYFTVRELSDLIAELLKAEP